LRQNIGSCDKIKTVGATIMTAVWLRDFMQSFFRMFRLGLQVSLVGFVGAHLSFCPLALAQAENQESATVMHRPQTPAVNYQTKLEFAYIDRADWPAGVPSLAIMPALQNSSTADGSGYRSFGLQRAFIDISYDLFQQSRLELSFRPEALSAGGIRRDFDTRAGVVRQAVPSLEFLDTYNVSYHAPGSFVGRIGVMAALSPRHHLDPSLQFGLDVQFPQKFLALELGWAVSRPQPLTASASDQEGWEISILTFDGHDDRVNVWAYNAESMDYGVRARDPFRGGAIRVHRHGATNFSALFYQITEQITGGKLSDVGLEMSVLPRELETGYGPLQFRLLGKYKQERGRRTTAAFPTLTHTSLALATRWRLDPTQDLLFNLHYGMGAIPNDERPHERYDLSGWQVAFDYRQSFGGGFRAKVGLAMESRIAELGGLEYSGFDLGEAGPRNLSRVLVGLDYDVSGSL
jgi:hypothetical protein